MLKDVEIEWVKLEDLIDYEQPNNYRVSSTNYKDEYKTPVLTPGKTFILGYTNETEGIYKATKEHPVIIFDDFTSDLRWIDFDFKVKSSALKFLTPKENINFRYCYHYMKMIDMTTEEHSRLWISKASQIKIPIPSIEIQNKIVETLDIFTKYVTELQAELQARSKQYSYYRNLLLSEQYLTRLSAELDKFEDEEREVVWKELGEISNLNGGYTPKRSNDEYWKNGTVPWFTLKDIRKNGDLLTRSIEAITEKAVKKELYPENSLILSTTATIGEVAIIKSPYICNQQLTSIKPNDEVNIRYLYYYFKNSTNELINASSSSGSVKIINQSNLKKLKIPIPPLNIQEKVVQVLDKFQSLIAETSGLLPKEREQRQKQYEYYRNKLLSFDINDDIMNENRTEQNRTEHLENNIVH